MKKSIKKRINKFIKRHLLSILLAAAIIAVLIMAFNGLHSVATRSRGYYAIGGEISVFALPALAYVAYLNIKDTVAAKKSIARKRGE